MPKRDESYMAARRREILDATIRCVERLGLPRTSTTAICKEGGLSMGALYTHFGSRDEILTALTGEIAENMAERLHFTSADQMFHVLIRRISGVFDPDAHPLVKLELQIVADSFDNPSLRTLTDQIYRASIQHLEASFAALPWLAPGVTPALATSLVESLTYGMVHRFATGTLGPPEEELPTFARLLEWISGKPAPADLI